MAKYITEQRKELISFLRENPDIQFSAKQIEEQVSGGAISISAVYRNLAALEEEGLICRSVKDGSREIFYQYIESDRCKEKIHLTCTKCGKTFHMNDSAMQSMMVSLENEDGFCINKQKTVLYGTCRDCR